MTDSDHDVAAVIARLDRDGYVILEDLLGPDEVAAARSELDPLLEVTPFGTNSFVGHRTRRIFGLLAKIRALDVAAAHPLIGALSEHYLGHHHLSSTVAIQIHPDERAQTMHSDDSAWPVPRGSQEIVLNSMWALDDFTHENGATTLIPRSHNWPDGRTPDGEPTVQAVMSAGSVLIYLGSLWHAGGANRTTRPRLGVILEYTSSWLRQQENLTLSCTPDIARHLSPRLAELIGYNLRPPFVGHVDGLHPLELLRDPDPEDVSA